MESYGISRWIRATLLSASIVVTISGSWFWALGGGRDALRVILPGMPYIVLLTIASYFILMKVRVAFKFVASASFTCVMLTDLIFLRFFREPFWQVVPHLPSKPAGTSFVMLEAYIKSYVTFDLLGVAIAITVLWVAFLGMARGAPRDPLYVLLILFVATTAHAWDLQSRGVTRFQSEFEDDAGTAVPLATTNRVAAIVADRAPVYEPSTIVFVILESAGRAVPSSDGETPLRDRIIETSGVTGWLDFDNAVTNSNATDVSIPSMLTGTGSHESIEKLQAMPFVMDLAHVRGYWTALVTSSTLNWANFDRFFKGAALDTSIFAEKFGQPFVNDATVDDMFAFRAAADLLKQHEGKLFLCLYANALHWPFQQTSFVDIPPEIKDRRSRGAYLQEKGFGWLYDALRESGRLEDALLIVVGDHGEFDYRIGTPVPIARVQTFEQGILSPIFLLKIPSHMPKSLSDVVRLNISKLVSSVDLAPSIAHVLGLSLTNSLSYSGSSLFGPLRDDRIAFSTAVNDWRSWTKSAIAVSRKHERLTCEARDLCKLQTSVGSDLAFLRNATPDDELFRAALANPVLRRSLVKIHRDHLGFR